MTYDPWRDVAERHPDVVIKRTDCLPARGAWIEAAGVILLEVTLDRPNRNGVLAHEVAHLDLGHSRSGIPWFDRRQEYDADRLAAARLLPIERLVEGLRWCSWETELAEHLDVPLDLVRRRLADLTAEEKDLLAERLWSRPA